MLNYTSLIASIVLVSLSGELAAQSTGDCGEPPVEPTLVEGATSSMEQLVANSKEVNAFIASADEFLDCSEGRYKRLSSSKVHRDELAAQIKVVTARRNEIGDEFNDQVADYKAANPQ